MAGNGNGTSAADNVWSTAQRDLDLAAERLSLDEGMHRVLRVPKRELEVHFPVTLDDGSVQAFTGYRVHHNLNRGPATGGIRYTQDLTLDLVRANAMLNTWKAALLEVPWGGAMGGVVVNPRRLSVDERQGLTRRYATEISLLIGPDRDIPTPDVNTGSQTMAWIMDTYSMHHGHTIPGVVTGKPIAVGGTRGRRESTSRGAFHCIDAAARARDLALGEARIAIQGFGRVGTTLAEMLSAVGARVVAIADDSAAVANPSGIDVAAAVEWMQRQDSIRECPGSEPIDRTDLFGIDCDILVSAGVQNQVTAAAADAMRAGILAEAANSPTTPEADAILRDRGILVVPDILCIAGGLLLGYFEWVQDTQAFFWADREIASELERIMEAAFAGVLATAERERVDLRGAAMMVAVGRVAEATALRGLYP
ncbi:MAG TPA: Glu/Leu/Phe/Val dehydrogenase [Candidatus Limnocylindria bacterium]|jgi:glutamate dehydrogenase (NAD(P)+)|nr:Glu/Leu/Phe/Val dehydrogenase [Candidatus Limnocylindria bacterium]